MNDRPLVSVIIPTYNRTDLVRRAVKSVLKQSYKNIEIIVVDDASEKDIESSVCELGEVRYFKNEENRGPCYSRNFGIKVSNGKYINFLDDDDILFPDKIEKQVGLFEESKDKMLGMVTCHARDERSGKEMVKYNKVKGNIYKELLYSFVVSGIETMLFKKNAVEKVGGYDENLQSSQEYDLLIRIAEFYTVDYVDEVLSQEFRSVNQISTNFRKKINGARYLYKKHDHRFKKQGILFYLKMKFKLLILLIRFYVGHYFGEKAYRILLVKM